MKKYYMKVVFIILISILYIMLGYSRSNAATLNGWVTFSSNKYYYVNNKPVKGKYKVTQAPKGVFYFSEKDGKMLSGWRTINGKKYYFSEKSGMVTGYQIINYKGYYFDANGIMKGIIKGYKIIRGKGYYFESNGTMARNKTVSGIKYTSSGICADLVKYKMAMKANNGSYSCNKLILIDYTTMTIALFKKNNGQYFLDASGYCSNHKTGAPYIGNYELGLKIGNKNNKYGRIKINGKNNTYAYYTINLKKGNKGCNYIHSVLYDGKKVVGENIKPKVLDNEATQLKKHNTGGCIRTSLFISMKIYNEYGTGTKVCIYKSK